MSYKFGEFELDGAKRILYTRGEPVDIPPKAVKILILLASMQ